MRSKVGYRLPQTSLTNPLKDVLIYAPSSLQPIHAHQSNLLQLPRNFVGFGQYKPSLVLWVGEVVAWGALFLAEHFQIMSHAAELSFVGMAAPTTQCS